MKPTFHSLNVKAIRKEIRYMIYPGVWRHQHRHTVPVNWRLVGLKWLFKKNTCGTYRARIVALGYIQVPGVDYTKKFAPVVNDVTFQVALVMSILKG